MGANAAPTPIAALRGSTEPTRGRGRPFAEPDAEENVLELTALRAEMRDMAEKVTPMSAYLWRRASIDGDPKAKAAAAHVVWLAKRLAERGTPPDAA